MTNYRLSYRHHDIVHETVSDIQEALNQNMPVIEGQSHKDILLCMVNQLNHISSIIKAHPNCRINRRSFYTLKDSIVYFLYIISNPYDKYKYTEDELPYSVKPRNIYVNSKQQKIYELTFNIGGEKVNITTTKNKYVSSSWLYIDELFNSNFIPNEEINNEPEHDYSYITDEDAVRIYDKFLDWIIETNLFFTMFFGRIYVKDLLQNAILKDCKYSVHLDPTTPRTKMGLWGRCRIYVYRYNYGLDTLQCAVTEISNINKVWTSPETNWMTFDEFAKLHGTVRGQRNYIVHQTEPIYEIPVIKEVAFAICQILEARNRRTHQGFTFLNTTLVKNNGN